LRASPSVLAGRFASADHRPAYGPSPIDFLEQQAAIREPLFAALDPIAIDVDAIDLDEVVARAMAALGSIGE
jgi:hypothetical protein